MIDKDKLYTKKEASECLGISVYSINAAIRIKRLVVEPREPGQKIKIKGSELQKYHDSRWDVLRRKPEVEIVDYSTIDGVLSECYRIANFVGLRIDKKEYGYVVLYHNQIYAQNLDLGCLLAFMQGADMMYRERENIVIPQYYR